ncbi:MAG: DUF4082 domain-containing protein, partial [Bacteroidota bacterium]
IYDGATCTTFSVSTNGFLTFNTGTTAVGSGTGAYGYQNTNFSSSTGSLRTLAPLYDDLVTVGNPGTTAGLNAAMKYQLTGSSPNRVLTVEWIGMEVYGNAGPNLNWQIKLYETTNVIEFVYGTMTASTATYTYSLGVNSLTISATPTASQLFTQQTQNTATFSATASNSLATVPATNTKITFTPAVASVAYKATFTAMNTGSATWCSGETRNVTVTVQNSGTSTWTNSSPDVNIGVKWSTNGSNWADYYVRADAGNLAPGATATYTLTLTAAEATAGPVYGSNFAAGTRTISFDVVKEGDCWFGNNSGSCGPGNSVYTSATQTISTCEKIVPSSGSNSYTLCSGNLYDYGGSAGDYSVSTDGYTVLYPSVGGNVIRIAGVSSAGESCCDYVQVYNGVGTGGTLLGTYYMGTVVPTLTSSDASGALTVRFYSDVSITGAGFNIAVSCVAPCVTPGVPTSLSGSGSGTTSANISWAAGSPGGSATVTYYYSVYTAGGSLVTSSSTTSTSASISGLTCGSSYYFTVYANTNCNNTSSSTATSANFTTYTCPCAPPAAPTPVTATPANICVGSSSNLNATSVGNTIKWYTASTGGSSIGTTASGVDFPVTPGTTTTYYAEALSSGTTYGNMLGTPTHTSNSSGSWTLGYSFTPSSNLTVTAVRRYFGSKISIWTDAGVLVASQAVSGTDGTWTQTNLSSPVTLTAGVTYRIGAFTNGGNYYWTTGLSASFANGTINQSYELGGDAFPTSTDAVSWWFVDIVYSTTGSGCTSATRTPVVVNVTALPAAPTSVTATPSTICIGGTSQLYAISAGNNINWWSASSGGSQLTQVVSGANYAVSPGTTTTYYAEAMTIGGTSGSQTFNYTGTIDNFTVPANVTSITITAKGAQGGSNGGTGGMGAILTGTFSVTPGQVLSILAGQQPPNNYSFAGGGGGTFVALGASYTTATPLIVAGGGGGATNSSVGGDASLTTSGNGPAPGTNGNGAPSTSCGGGGGGFYSSGASDNLTSPSFIATGGAGFQQGGAGGSGATSYSTGGFGGGASPNYYGSCNMQGGAGGGYSGGSGLNSGSVQYTGYGGGSYNGGTNPSNSVGNTGNGQVVISWTSTVASCPSTTRTAVTVNVNTQSTAPTSISGTTVVCPGGSTTLTTNGGSLGTEANDVWYLGTCATDAFTQEWTTQPYGTPNTTVNSVSNGILNVTSQNNDPMIDMAGLGSFDPNIYRYINIRYRVTSGSAGGVEIFFYNTAHNYAVGGETGYGTLISDNAWHTLSVDMFGDPDYTTGGNIQGWRYDWATAASVTMDIDFISLSDRPMIGEGSSITVTPSSNPTTYSTAKKGACNTTSCATIGIATTTVTAASSSPNFCVSTLMTNITHTTTGCSGITNDGVSGANGLPAGVSAHWASNTITISGTPTASGTFNYSIPVIGGCASVYATGTISVTANITAGSASSSPTPCINTLMTSITHTTSGATGISNDNVSGANGLPAGVSAHWAGNTITISGTPTAAGTFNYSIPLSGGCGTASASGTIYVTANMTAGSASYSPNLCINSALSPSITHSTSLATGISNDNVSGANGLPAGVSAHWASNTITISGTPTASGTFNYSIPLTGGCGTIYATGTITVNLCNPTITLGTSPSVCSGVSAANLPYLGTTASPDQYSIDYDLTAEGQGFVDVVLTSLPASPIALVVPSGAAPGVYNATITVKNSSTGFSSTPPTGFSVTVKALPSVSISGSTNICIGSTTNVLPATGGTWLSSNAGIASVANGGLVTGVSNGTASFTFTETASGCSNATGEVTVYPAFNAGSILTTGQTICYNGDPSVIGNNVAASGGNSAITYQWQSSTDNFATTPTDISSNTASYDPPSGLTVTTYYRRQAKDGSCNTIWSNSGGVWVVSINALPTASPGFSTNPICSGASTTLSANATAGSGTITTYAWSSGIGGNNASGLVSTAGTYTVTVTNSNGCSASATSAALSVLNNSSAPVVSSPICSASNSVSGTSTEADGTVITVYKGGISQGTTTVSSGVWTMSGLTLAGGNVITATATASGFCVSSISSPVTIKPTPNAPTGNPNQSFCEGISPTVA